MELSELKTKIGVCKYNNVGGVSCYVNSILSILQQLPLFSDFIVNESFDHDRQNISYQLKRVLKTSLSYDDKNITPTKFLESIAEVDNIWGQGEQQDAQEFLNFLLNQLEKENMKEIYFDYGINKNINKTNNINQNLINIIANSSYEKFIRKEYSIMIKLFGGMFYNTIICSKCGNNSNRFETFQMLQLPIPENSTQEYSLDQLLEHYTKTETLDDKNMLRCDFCKYKNKSKKNIYFWKTPKILIIQLKRFKVNMYGIPTTKLNNMITYPINGLDINNYVHEYSNNKDAIYDLVGVNLHKSIMGINFGHYTNIAKNRFDNKWYYFDDSSPVINVKSKNEIIRNDAYLLFYYKR